MRLLTATALLLLLAACGRAPAPAPAASEAPVTTQAEEPAVRDLMAVPPPSVPMLTGADVSNLAVEVVHLGRLIVRFEHTPMQGVRTDVGAGVFDEQGDGADWQSWLCYTVPRSQRVWITTGRLGGSGEFASGFTLVRDARADANEHCPELPEAFRTVVLEPDIRLGMSQTEVERRFGAAEERDGWRLYQRLDVSDRDNMHREVTHTLALKLEAGRVTAIEATRSTAN